MKKCCKTPKLRLVKTCFRKRDGARVRKYHCGSCGATVANVPRLRAPVHGTAARFANE